MNKKHYTCMCCGKKITEKQVYTNEWFGHECKKCHKSKEKYIYYDNK